jgi:hypothetical protein
MYSFIDVVIDGLNYVRSVTLSGAALNPSWHLTAAPHSVPEVTAVRERTVRSTVAFGRLWLSLRR